MQQLMVLSSRKLEWRETVELKRLDATDALVRPVALSVCDADVAYFSGVFPTRGEFCFGHEFVADVVQTGEAVTLFARGDRVVVAFLIACGTCDRCRKGFSGACRGN